MTRVRFFLDWPHRARLVPWCDLCRKSRKDRR